MSWCRHEATLSQNKSYWFQRQNVTWYNNVQGRLSWKWRFMSIAEGWGFARLLFLNISATLRWVGSIDPKPKWRYDEPSRILPTPKSHDDGVKVSCSRETCYHKVFSSLSQIFPGHLSTSTSLFFNKLEEDSICLIYNSTLRGNNVSLFNNLTSLAMNETRFLPWLTRPFLFYVLMNLMTMKVQSFFIFREFEKEDERKMLKYLFVNLSLRLEKV